MVSREHKRAILHEKLQLLRSITNSRALNETSIIVDASKYIEELKQKVESLNQDIGTSRQQQQRTDDGHQSILPKVKVQTLEKGYKINVYSEKSCPGLLVSILEAFEDLGLNVLEARVSCTNTFHLEAVGGGDDDEDGQYTDTQVVKETVLKAIKNWRGVIYEEVDE